MDKRMKELNATTRWLPDSAFTTYFGKPAFHAYGKGNVCKGTIGGNIYGHYLLTHNVNPECGVNPPEYQQVYDNALRTGLSKGDRKPHLPRKFDDKNRLTED
jgi:hypothetical protein